MNLNQEEEHSEFITDPVERVDQESVELDKGSDTQKKSRRLPELWTRVISISSDNLTDLKVYSIASDLLLEQGYEKVRKRKGDPEWEIHFSPKLYLDQHPNLDLERSRLTVDRLKKYGEQVSKIRGWIIERAIQVEPSLSFDVSMKLSELSHIAKR